MDRPYTEPPMSDAMNVGMGPKVDRPATALEDHAQQLETLLGGLERAALQYENMLNRLRGSNPTVDDSANQTSKPVGTLDRIHLLSDNLNNVCSRINNTADELNGII